MAHNNKSPKSNYGIHSTLVKAALIPMIILFTAIMITSYITIKKAMTHEVETELQAVSSILIDIYDREYPGDYRKIGTEYIAIYKGDTMLNDDFQIIDEISADTDVEITVFFEDFRVLTTIKNKDGNRITGTTANLKVKQDVLDKQKATFYDNIIIDGKEYYGYYVPLFNSDDTCTGMVCVGKPMATVNSYVVKNLLPIIAVSILGMILVSYVIFINSRKIADAIKKIEYLLTNISKGKLDGNIDGNILKRDDELSSIGKSVIQMQRSLKELVELDTLTGINNRRSGENRLATAMSNAMNKGTKFSVAIGDIDYFKKFNDTYGHDCGDKVLITVASILKNSMIGKGHAARWGGEEFLLIFDGISYDDALETMNSIENTIRNTDIEYKEQTVSVRMSFGITQGDACEESRVLLKRADELLYYAKEHGRNQVVTDFTINSVKEEPAADE
ncbi:MAG: diguanylate cyclase [Lachnospira sp.]